MWRLILCVISLVSPSLAVAQTAAWSGYAGDSQHMANSAVASQTLGGIRWQTPVDLAPVYSGNDLLIHYGSPTITAANTVVVPVKTGALDGFKIEGRSGTTGALLWTQTTDYALPPHAWTPSYSPTIAPGNKVYYPGAGGTVYTRGNLDSAGATTPTQLAFFGNSTYTGSKAAYDTNVFINTPITSDNSGNIFFGYQVKNSALVGGLQSGLAKIDSSGNGSFVSALTLAGGDAGITNIAQNSAPAIKSDGSKLYVAVTTADSISSHYGNGYLVSVNPATMSVLNRVDLREPAAPTTTRSTIPNSGSASPTIGPDGRVFFGTLESPVSTSKGWMHQFNADLTSAGKPGAFGWDNTPSIVPATMVPSYTGSSSYLLMTKYNNYAGLGGDGVNKLAILDPNATQVDSRSGQVVMKEVLTIAGVTPDAEFLANHPNAVREWCINTAVVDPLTHSILVNSEDGKLYRWDLFTNTFTQVVTLTAGVGEAYTPTLIGPDGTVYAINNATLFAVGVPVPEPAHVVGIALGLLVFGRLLFRRLV